MSVTWHRVLLIASLLIAAAGIVLWLSDGEASPRLAVSLIGTGLAGFVVVNVLRPKLPERLDESDDITTLSMERRRELMRGTSLYLRDMPYRYSVRLDKHVRPNRRPFTADVNTIRLGFVPAIITDNSTDREGAGFVAFVHDGRRWRGPGLPCPADHVKAVRHAARCVAPLEEWEEEE